MRRRLYEPRELWAIWGLQQASSVQAAWRHPKPGVRCGEEGWKDSSHSTIDSLVTGLQGWRQRCRGASGSAQWKAAKLAPIMSLVRSALVVGRLRSAMAPRGVAGDWY